MNLLSACKLAYRKHHLDDESVGWEELGNALLDALCNEMGTDEYILWVKQLRAALEKIIIKLEREGCTHRGCDQGIHTIQCPMEVVLLLEQALKGGE